MLIPEISVRQENCNELIFRDITPDYSASHQNGYGGYNVDPDKIIWAQITLDFGNGQQAEIGSNYYRSKGDWIIKASDIPYQNPNASDDCESCGHNWITNNHGFLSTFPSGCIGLIYEVFTADPLNSLPKISKGIKVAKIVSSCKEDKMFAEISFKLALQASCSPRRNPVTRDTRKEDMESLVLAWAKMKLLNPDEGCDCDCVAGRIQEINNLLTSINVR